jgi:hypothetical protein
MSEGDFNTDSVEEPEGDMGPDTGYRGWDGEGRPLPLPETVQAPDNDNDG